MYLRESALGNIHLTRNQHRFAQVKSIRENRQSIGQAINSQSWIIQSTTSNEIENKRQALVHAIEWQESHFIGKKLKP